MPLNNTIPLKPCISLGKSMVFYLTTIKTSFFSDKFQLNNRDTSDKLLVYKLYNILDNYTIVIRTFLIATDSFLTIKKALTIHVAILMLITEKERMK
jgi:hypothetical protein